MEIGSRVGAYEVIAKLGVGGMGEVYRARDTRLNRDVALKVLPEAFLLDADRLARFEREAQVLASLNHPNIGAIYGLEDSNGTRALVLELVEGPTLADRIARGPVPLDEALSIARQIAEALEAAHEQGIIHRDLKPANIKLRPDGTVKVLDFGLAKLNESGFGIRDSGSDDRLRSQSPTITSPAMTLAGVILGTAAYMSPEQAKGGTADKRSDVWAFGCVFYEMLTGDQLFKGETVADTLASVLKERPDWERVPPTLRRLLRACLETDPKRRLSAIGNWPLLLDEPSAAIPARWQSRAWAGIAAALLSVLIALTTFLALRRPPLEAHAFQYAITPPDNRSVHSFAISPDARYLVMAAGIAGRRELWLRPLDALQWQLLPSTEGAAFPFWSPDGRQIAFFAEGALKKITTIGAPPQRLCTCDGRGTWSRDDVILIATVEGEIRRIPATGGILSDAFKTGARTVDILPDGKRFLYGASPQPNLSSFVDVHLASLAGSEDRVILSKVSSYTLGAGYLLFTRENTLMAQAFDASSGQIAGEPFPIADGVAISPRGPYTAVAVSHNDVLVHVNAEGREASQIAWVDRSGGTLGSASFSGRMPAVAPDARTIAYARRGSGSSWNVWLRDVARGSDLSLTSGPRSNNAPFWSPAGDRVLYRSAPADASELGLGDLYWADTGGGPQEALVTGPVNKIPTQWSKDGRWIVYTQNDPKTAWDVWVVPAAGESPDRKPIPFIQSDAYDFQGQLSPDSRWMAYASDESGQREVYVRPFPSGPGRWKLSIDGGSQPRWRGDGAELYFAAAAGKMMAVSVKATPGARPTFEASVPTPLFDTRLYDGALAYEYDVTADGQRFVVNTNVAGAYATPLTVVVNWTAPLKK